MYKHFNKETRIELSVLLRAKHTPKECAKELGFDKSTVTREIRKNVDSDNIYRGASAHKKYLEKRRNAKRKSRKIENNLELCLYIKKKLKNKNSPEQIVGRGVLLKERQLVSRETIYRWIFNSEPQLKKYLRRIGKKGKYRRKRGTIAREKAREEGKIRRIDARPQIVEERKRIGDWEGDTIVGKDKTKRLLTNVDRLSGYGMIDRLDMVRSSILQDKLIERFKKVPKSKKYTYTYDNGTEIGKEDLNLEKNIKMKIYRANPYHSWERGSNENFNGLIREFFPKGTDFANISDRDVKRVEYNLNHRPRKRLGYLTPYEVYVLGMTTDALQV